MNALVRQGYRTARAVTRHHARSFSLASLLLFGARRRAAFALYAFCRRLDDLVDQGGDGEQTLFHRLARARALIGGLYLELPRLADPTRGPVQARAVAHPTEGAWDAAELAALRDTIRRYGIPEQPFQDLVSGMEMDVAGHRYASFADLELYCYRVAGTVGLLLCPVLGTSDARAATAAADLGRAMQLTNILRDVREDLARGRVYLPEDELVAFGLSREDLAQGVVDDRWRAFMRWQIARARAYYARAAAGVGWLTGFGAQRMVKLMGALYGGILADIEARGYDVFSARAHVTLTARLRTGLAILVRPRAVLPSPSEVPAVPLLPRRAP
ncbi:MAG: phytoene/squalene synthase family protein [Myxococcaceae bacterium]|nr:MAG: phytoene/squalene synthase family protein [Myxococcaceae bacterium]